MIQLAVFIVLSILLLAFTLRRPHRHRFYRFFAFESLLGLVLLNSDTWFRNPFTIIQFISWIFLAGSLLLALHGFQLLRIAGSPKGDIEETTQLVTIGAYRYIRHPLYCSLLVLGVGAFLKEPSLLGFLLLILVVVFVYATGKVEERDNLTRFGSAYREYMQKTKMFIPFLL
jgi:protein-S-isoprenylcysteine O-methyltransferase Ste14